MGLGAYYGIRDSRMRLSGNHCLQLCVELELDFLLIILFCFSFFHKKNIVDPNGEKITIYFLLLYFYFYYFFFLLIYFRSSIFCH